MINDISVVVGQLMRTLMASCLSLDSVRVMWALRWLNSVKVWTVDRVVVVGYTTM